MNRHGTILWGLAMAASVVTFAPLKADLITTIAVHEGANDPTTEDNPDPLAGNGVWTRIDGIPAATVGPNYAENAWVVTKGTSGSTRYNMPIPLGGPIATQAATRGWGLIWNLKLPTIPNSVSSVASRQVEIHVGINNKRYIMRYGTQADGDPIMVLFVENAVDPSAWQTFNLEGVGAGYHNYVLLWDPDKPGGAAADIWVDGQMMVSNYRGRSDSGSGLHFGAVGGSVAGEGRWNHVVFFIGLPEPASASMVALGALALMRRRRR